MTKVLFAIDDFEGPVAGTETQFWNVLTGLDRNLIEPGVLLLRPSAFLARSAPDIAVRTMRVSKLFSPTAVFRAFSAALWARRNGYRIVHTFLNDVSILLPWPMRLMGIRVIVSRRDEGFWYTRKILRVLKVNRPVVSCVIANANAVADAVVQHEGYGRSDVVVMPNGIKPPASNLSNPEARNRFGLSAEAVVFTIIANLRPLKRVEDAIAAVAGLAAGQPDWILLVAGADRPGRRGDSHRRELEELAGELGVSDRVRFLGAVEDTDTLIAASDVGVLCSETEGMSNSLLQFMFAGKPVIASAVGGNVEIVEQQRTGITYPVGEVDELRRAIRLLGSDASLRREYGSYAGRRAEERYSVGRLLEDLTRLYRGEAFNRSPKPGGKPVYPANRKQS